MKYLKIVFLISTISLSSCYAQKDISTKAVKELLESIYINDSISSIKFNSTPYFHCNIVEESKGIIFTDIVLTQKPAKNFCYSMDVFGIKSYVYGNCNNTANELDSFFIPDVKAWRFAIEVIKDNFILYELKRYPNIYHKQELNDSFKL